MENIKKFENFDYNSEGPLDLYEDHRDEVMSMLNDQCDEETLEALLNSQQDIQGLLNAIDLDPFFEVDMMKFIRRARIEGV